MKTRTTKSYDVNGIGTVCTVVSDTINSFYDNSGQEGPYLLVTPATPTGALLTTTINETLSLHTSNVAQVASAKRVAQSAGTFALLPVSLVANRVQYIARSRQAAKIAAFRKSGSIKSMSSKGGVK